MTLQRGEHLEDLESKSNVLENQSRQFHANAVKLKRHFCMQSYRLAFLILIILAVRKTENRTAITVARSSLLRSRRR